MRLTLRDGLLFLSATVRYQGKQVTVPNLVVDTGSAATLLSTDAVAPAGIVPEPDDVLHVVRSIAGAEVVFSRRLDGLQVGKRTVTQFEVEIGGVDPAFDINGILGLDFLLRTGAVLDLGTLTIHFPGEHPALEQGQA